MHQHNTALVNEQLPEILQVATRRGISVASRTRNGILSMHSVASAVYVG